MPIDHPGMYFQNLPGNGQAGQWLPIPSVVPTRPQSTVGAALGPALPNIPTTTINAGGRYPNALPGTLDRNGNPVQGPGLSTGSSGSFGQGPYQPGASPNLESITDLVNRLDLTAQQTANAGRVPGGQSVENQLMGNTASLARGQLPQDVIDQIQQRAAERGISTGNSDYLKALGLTSLQAEQTAQGDLSAAYARNPAAPIFDPTSQILTPGQAGGLNNQLNIANANLGLEWYYALHPELRSGVRGGGGVGQPPAVDNTGGTANWFSSLMGGTPSSSLVTPAPSTAGGFTSDPLYTGTSISGLPNLGGILGPQDPGYGLSPDPYGQTPYGGDASNPGYWNINPAGTTANSYDPFSLYGG